ncbi:MAG TPA: DoxX family protein [Acidimicrobiales bacterium]
MASGEHDFSALVLRGAIGPMLIAHGANKVFGPGGLDGTTRWFDSLGLKPPWLHARLAAATELGAGALVTAGALHPWSEAAVIGLMTAAAATDHRGKGFFIFKGGWEYTAVVGAAAAALAGLGHGRLSFDHLIGRDRTAAKFGILAVAVGAGAAAGLIGATYRPETSPPQTASPEATSPEPSEPSEPQETTATDTPAADTPAAAATPTAAATAEATPATDPPPADATPETTGTADTPAAGTSEPPKATTTTAKPAAAAATPAAEKRKRAPAAAKPPAPADGADDATRSEEGQPSLTD